MQNFLLMLAQTDGDLRGGGRMKYHRALLDVP